MATLGERDYVDVLDLLGALHACRDTPEAIETLMARLPAVVPLDLVSYNDIDLTDPTATRTHYAPHLVPQPQLEAAFQALQREHPLLLDWAASADPRPRRMSDFVTLPQLRGLDLWREVFRPLETNHQIGMALSTAQHHVVALGLNRWRRDFSDRDLAVTTILSTHLPAALDHARLRGRLAADRPGVCDVLTPREAEVLALVAEGCTNREIAQRLYVSLRTVDKHVENLRTKLGARSRTEAAALFLRRSSPQTPAAGAGA